MADAALAIVIGFHVFAVLLGLAVLTFARHRPRLTATAIGVIVAVGLGLVWFGAWLANDDYEVGQAWYRAGMALALAGVPSWMLVGGARDQSMRSIRGWCQMIGTYLFVIWMLALFLGVVAFFVTSPSRSFR